MTDRSYESASFLSHAETPSGLAFLRYPAFSCGVQRKPTRAVAGFLIGGLPLGRLGLSMPNYSAYKYLDKPSCEVFNVLTLNKEAVMENIKQTLKIESIGTQVTASLLTEWDVPGQWFEKGRLLSGLVGKSSTKTLSFFSVVEAQNLADEVGAEFVGLRS